MSWKNIVGTVAPTIGQALGGSLGGMAVTAICEALGLPVGSSEKDIEKAIGNSPEQLVKLKEAEFAFEAKMKELGINLEKIHADDRANARNRETVVKDKTPAVLAAFVVGGFFSVLIFILRYGIPDNGGEALLVMLGALGAANGAVISYYFGSSSSSVQKNEIIARKGVI